MKSPGCFLVLLFLFQHSLLGKIELAGVFQFSGKPLFSLVDSEAGARSGWVEVGQSYRGYKIESYDPDQGVLRLVSSKEELLLRLRSAVVQAESSSADFVVSARAFADLKQGELLVTGGFKDPEGKHIYVFVEPEQVKASDGTTSIQVQFHLYAVRPEAMQAVGLEQLATAQKSIEQHGQIWSAADYQEAHETLLNTTGTDMLIAPPQTVLPGEEAVVEIGSIRLSSQPKLTADESRFAIDFALDIKYPD